MRNLQKRNKSFENYIIVCLVLLSVAVIAAATFIGEQAKEDSLEIKQGLSFFMNTFDIGGVVVAYKEAEDFSDIAYEVSEIQSCACVKVVLSLGTLIELKPTFELIKSVYLTFGYQFNVDLVYQTAVKMFERQYSEKHNIYPVAVIVKSGTSIKEQLDIFQLLNKLRFEIIGLGDAECSFFEELHVAVTPLAKGISALNIENAVVVSPLSVLPFDGATCVKLLDYFYDSLPKEIACLFGRSESGWQVLSLIEGDFSCYEEGLIFDIATVKSLQVYIAFELSPCVVVLLLTIITCAYAKSNGKF